MECTYDFGEGGGIDGLSKVTFRQNVQLKMVPFYIDKLSCISYIQVSSYRIE